ncbi:MAG: hypothetical protein RLZ53_752 [Actinomycetota bacterium]|jgi:hypothetical protein
MTREWKAFLGTVLVFAFLSAGLSAEASVDTRYVSGSDKQAFLFNPLVVNKFEIKMTEAEETALRNAPTEYHAATLKATTPKGVSSVYRVGVRIKGGWGSYRDLDSKAGFKIKMNFSVKGQKFYGMKKLTLNNMVQDASMLHEAVSYRLFRAMGVPAPRVGYANVFFNGINYGLHSNIETYDDQMFERWKSGETAHLYEGGYGTEVGPDMEVDDGSATDKSDVIALQEINNNLSGADWFNAVRTKVDLNEMIMNWAVEHYIGHWDGYTRGWPNNYFIHRVKGGLFTMHPWGTDQTWGGGDLIDDGATMMTRCVQYQPCNELYRAAMAKIEEKLPSLNLPGMVDRIWSKIRAANESDPRKPYSHEDSIGSVEATKSSIVSRFEELRAFNGSRTLATITLSYSTRGFKVAGVLKPKLSRTGTGVVSYSRIQGDGVCDVDAETGWVTLHRGGTCWVAAQTAQTETYQAAVRSLKIQVPMLASRLTVASIDPIAKGQLFTLPVTADSASAITSKVVSGKCRVSGLNVRALASSGSCKIALSVASDGIFGKATKTVVVNLTS